MKMIITGALGHIGSSLIQQFSHRFGGAKLVLIDDLSTQRYCSLFNLSQTTPCTFIEGKVQSLDVDSILSDADVVVHLAATTDAAGTADKPDLVHQNNFDSTKCLAESCMRHDVPLIFPSSTSVYGSQESLVDEDCLDLVPQSPYARCKIKEEAFLKELFQKGLRGIICRLGTIYGVSPGMRFHTAVNKFCWQAVMQQPITVWETAMDQKRPYLALEDAAQAIGWIIQQTLYDGKVYNIVTGNHTVRDVLNIIESQVPGIDVSYVSHKIMNQLSYEVSAHRFKNKGFLLEVPLTKVLLIQSVF